MPVRGLTLIVVAADAERLRAGLTLAAAQAALGGRARIFCQGDAVALLAPPLAAPDDARHRAAGLPDLATLMDEALALGVELLACQSGLALAGLDAAALDSWVTMTGPVAVLQGLGEDRLAFV